MRDKIIRSGRYIMTRLVFETKRMNVAELGEESSVPDLFGELTTQNSLVFDLDEDDEIYEGYGKVNSAFPYRQLNGYTRELHEKDVKTAVLENEYLKAVFLTEYGGRLWELWDKKTGKNLLYTNDVLRFSNLAIRNAWFSGGVEWNLGIIGHNPLTTEPLYVAKTQTDEGDPVLRMYEYERIRGVIWQMDFWLEEACPYLNCRMRIVNDSNQVIPMYWWSNMAVPEYEGGRLVVPAKEAFTAVGTNGFKVEIPFVNGIDVTDYKKIPTSIDYFFHIPKEEPKYIANIAPDGYGLLQFSTPRLQGRKLFSWGNIDASDRWQEFLTDDAWVITRNTIAYNLLFIFGGLVFNVAMAIGLSELRNKAVSKLCQTVVIMPHFLSYVIVSFLVLAFLHVENGLINRSLIPALGLEGVDWYSNPKYWPWILVIVNFWKTTGYGSVVYLAGIAGIDTSLYEAAKVDGASRWQQIRYITLPALVPLMVVLTILNVGKIFNSDFGLFYQVPLNTGALYPATNVISTYVYNMLMSAGTGSVGMASAAAFYQSIVGFILVMTTNFIVKKISPENALF